MERRRLIYFAAGGFLILALGAPAVFRCGSSADNALLDPPPEPAPSGAPAIRFIGRFDRGDIAGPRFAWSGSAIHARFRGTQASMKLRDSGPNTYTVLVDKQPPRKLVSGPQQETHILATALASGEHDLTVIKNTEAFVGEAQFLGFDFGPGGELLPPRTHARRIEIVGDSISAAFGVEGTNAECKFSPSTENAYAAYGSITARALGADVSIIAWSGKGIVRNGDGKGGELMPALYERALPQYTWSTWDSAAWLPDAVVVNLGTNDFYADGPVDEASFVAGYRAFLEAVRKRNGSAPIVVMIGTMLNDDDPAHPLTLERKYVSRVVKEMSAAGDTRITFLEVAPIDSKKEGFACGEHPSAATHRRMAAELTRTLRNVLGW